MDRIHLLISLIHFKPNHSTALPFRDNILQKVNSINFNTEMCLWSFTFPMMGKSGYNPLQEVEKNMWWKQKRNLLREKKCLTTNSKEEKNFGFSREQESCWDLVELWWLALGMTCNDPCLWIFIPFAILSFWVWSGPRDSFLKNTI